MSVGSLNGPVLINTKLIKVRLLQITTPFLSSCHFINLNVFSIHTDSFPSERERDGKLKYNSKEYEQFFPYKINYTIIPSTLSSDL